MQGVLTSPCLRPLPLRGFPSTAASHLLPAKTLAIRPRGLRSSPSPSPPRAATEAAASVVGGMLAPLSTLEA
ncbi:hypothetical protein GUJ93_ZPchr0002g24783 [Zizania palustris]|uniref:Uncharacterized protein n=1 Tax=Zizania palustris TaxID=103762 RepID=A0A8J5RDT4_ZIZPA|nr:hypothetical protein GUJ93_ZPchr0002g24783 [Zizania palustris]